MAYHKDEINYSGRTVDLLLLQFVRAPVSDVIVNPDISHSPRVATGIEKMVQRFALIFLTQVNTVKNQENEGTEFLSLLGNGQIYNESTLRSAATVANKVAFQQIRAEDVQLDTPDDEALKTSEVIKLEMDRATATVKVTIRLTSEAGETYTYITPVETGT